MELANYYKDQRKYDKDKATVFGLIVAQCSDVAKRALESDPAFKKMKVDRDVIGVMKKLKAFAFSKSARDEPFMAVAESVKRITALQQGNTESILNYYKRFSTQSEVLEEQWGVFGPPVLANLNNDSDLKKSKKSF